MLDFYLRRLAFTLVATLTACGPSDSKSTDTTDSSTTADPSTGIGTTETPTTAAPTTDAATTDNSTSTGDAPTLCADAGSEAECMAATEMDEELGLRCRWATVQRFVVGMGGEGCSFEPAGGTCVLANFAEGGAGCFGFWREPEPGEVVFARWDCGTPKSDEWQSCFEIEMASPGHEACFCMNAGG